MTGHNPKPIKICNTCNGYGLHASGDNTPMGAIDADDGMPTIACQSCKANPNSYEELDKSVQDNQTKDKLGSDFISFMESMGAIFIDATPKTHKSHKKKL
jgi:hypothetical protein